MNPTLYHQTENTNDFELSTAVHTDATDNYGDPHFHKNMELLLVLCGTCECTVGNSNYLLKSGEAILILPYQSHAFSVPSGARVRRVTFTALLILTLAKGIEGRSAGTPVFLPSADTFAYFNAQLSGALGEGLECHRQLETIARMKVKGILYMIGSEFLASAELTPNGLSTTLAEELIRYIEENFRRDVTLHELAERTGYNYQYLSRSFNKAFGVSFKQMLNRYRLDSAYTMLQDTDLPIAEIAFESGFQSIRSFDQTVLDYYGCSPKELRRAARGEGSARGLRRPRRKA